MPHNKKIQRSALRPTLINIRAVGGILVWRENKEKTPLDNAKELTGYIIQTIENHMLYPLEQGQSGDQKQDLKRVATDLAKLQDILAKVEQA